MLFKELLTKRERIDLLSFQGLKIIAKRLLNMPGFLSAVYRDRKLRSRGANIGVLVIIEKTTIQGRRENLTIGDGSFIGEDAKIYLHDKLYIGRNVVINSEAKLFTASHFVDSENWALKTLPIEIGDSVWIATGAIILPGSKIGRGAVIGAGAVISGEVDEYSVVVGNPGREIRKRKKHDFHYCPAKFTAMAQAWLGKEE